jgi:hypothetical protein
MRARDMPRQTTKEPASGLCSAAGSAAQPQPQPQPLPLASCHRLIVVRRRHWPKRLQ